MRATAAEAQHHDEGRSYRPDIDGLRAVAILSVVGAHAFPSLTPGGFVGVDIFFVLSGYLISSIILNGLHSGDFRFSTFYTRRANRIFPALLLVLCASYLFGRLTLFPEDFAQLGKHVAGSAGFIQNFLLWQESGYFDKASELKPLLHIWSLGVEEQFYLVYPCLLWLAWRCKLKIIVAVLLVAMLSFTLNIVLVSTEATSTFYLPHTRFWELLMGSALAAYQISGNAVRREPLNGSPLHIQSPRSTDATSRSASHENILAVTGLFLLAVSVFCVTKARPFPGWQALLPTAGTVLLIAAGPASWINRTILSSRLLVFVGIISYPLYLWHWPILTFYRIHSTQDLPWHASAVAIILSVGLAWMTYRFLERPVRFKGRGNARTAIVLAALLAMLGGAGYHSFQNQKLPFEAPRPEIRLPLRSGEPAAKTGNATVTLIGDSHAKHLVVGLHELLDKDLGVLVKAGCIPFFDVDRYDSRFKPGGCVTAMTMALESIETDDAVKVVVLASMGPVYLTGQSFNGSADDRIVGQGVTLRDRPDITDPWEVYRTGMTTTLARLSRKNKKIIFVLDVPELGFDPRSCVENTASGWSIRSVRTPCAVSRADFDQRTRKYHALVAEVLKGFPQVVLFDASDKLCDDKWCWASKNDTLLYRDVDHLSPEGSRFVGAFLHPLIRQELAR
jgi:peptidoglycan/LPS O-acetylase OafA/YrhL